MELEFHADDVFEQRFENPHLQRLWEKYTTPTPEEVIQALPHAQYVFTNPCLQKLVEKYKRR